MAWGPITSWQIDGETVTDFIFLGSKITAGGDYSHEIKRWLLFGRKVMTNLDSILKSRDYFADKGLSVQSYGFFSSYAWMWELDYKESRAPRIDAFELWCWRRLLRVHWTARRSNQFILKEISPECSLEGLMLKLKLQYFGYFWGRLTHWKRPWCWERWKAGEEGDNRGWAGWMATPTQWHEFEQALGFGDGHGREAWHAAIHGVTKSRTLLSNWTDCLTTDILCLTLMTLNTHLF